MPFVVCCALVYFWTLRFSRIGDFYTLRLGFFGNLDLRIIQVNIVALKPSTIFSVNRQALHDFYNTDMETLRYNSLMAENLYEMVYSRLLESYCKTPEERYRRLTTRYPKIEQEIPLCKIASFLNVTPETISHIRKKIVKNS